MELPFLRRQYYGRRAA